MVIFDEEAIGKIYNIKLQVDDEKVKENKRKSDLLDFTYQCLKEFPGIATRIGLKKKGPSFPSDTNKYGWALYFQPVSGGNYLHDFPKGDNRLSDNEIREVAKTINYYFETDEDVRKMIIAALTGRPISL